MKTPTLEQKAKSAERREKFRALAKQVAAMTDEQKAHLTSRLGAVPTCEGRALSLHNTLLLLLQCPGVVMVGGFRQWLKAGRCVRKGEHGHLIWFRANAGADKDKQPGEISSKELADDADPRFLMATVFDVGQTEEIQKEQVAA